MLHRDQVTYIEDPSDQIWWCQTHKRWATFLQVKYGQIVPRPPHVCDPRLGGITMVCDTIEVSDIVKAVKEELQSGNS